MNTAKKETNNEHIELYKVLEHKNLSIHELIEIRKKFGIPIDYIFKKD